ncbi:hypothetical protein KA001_02505, partial [Patescibacteria group bacterium]|nr:hypothetical protein [Patescibacteria group bacterium]
GLLVPLFLISIKEFKKTDENFFLVTWVLISLILSFFPFGFARFYLRGLFLPIILFVILNSKQYVKILDLPKILIFILLAVVIPISSFFVFYKRIDEVTKNNHWYYLTTDEIDATNYLKTKKGGIFSYYTLGNYVPAVTNSAVYFGHFIQTPNSQLKIMNIAKFYSNTYSEEEARKLLKNENISYVFYGSEEKEITKNYSKQNVLNYSFLDTVFKNDQVTIYSVKH